MKKTKRMNWITFMSLILLCIGGILLTSCASTTSKTKKGNAVTEQQTTEKAVDQNASTASDSESVTSNTNDTTEAMKKIGEAYNNQAKQGTESSNSDIFAQGKTAIVTKSAVEVATKFYMARDKSDEKTAQDKAVQFEEERQAMYQEALKNGYTVTDDEVNQYIATLKEQIAKADNKGDVQILMNEFDSQDDYWAYEFQVYKIDLPIQKYISALYGTDIDAIVQPSSTEESDVTKNLTQLKEKLVKEQDYKVVNP